MDAATRRTLKRKLLSAALALDSSDPGKVADLITAAIAWRGSRGVARGRPKMVSDEMVRDALELLTKRLGRVPKVDEVADELGVGYQAARRAMLAAGWKHVRVAPVRQIEGPSDDEWLAAWKESATIRYPYKPAATDVVKEHPIGTVPQCRRAIARLRAAGRLEVDKPAHVRDAAPAVDDFG